ncbi:MAG: hypothetical protein A2Z96_00470 [Spirochaetes bacterium GWB1_48_6]|nr:MAG: hypothetical protein A2Z96_00470 [Spirochaetes bacterium GWB1_48_6]
MKTLQRMLFQNVLYVFLFSIFVFSFFLSLVDLFNNLSAFMRNNVDFLSVLQPTLFFLPKAMSFSLPMSLLFAVAFTLGNMYANNELIAIFCSGLSLKKLVTPILILGLGISVFFFVFEDAVVIPSMRIKTELTNKLLKNSVNTNVNNVTIYSNKGKILYNISSYNDLDKRLYSVIVLKKGTNFLQRLDAETAEWKDDHWILKQVRMFNWDPKTDGVTETWKDLVEDFELIEPPATFRRKVTKLEEMTISQASEFISSQKSAGFPTLEAETDFWARISFALTPLIVAFLSSSVGGRFKKNILIFSLFLSLAIGVVYYVLQMVLKIMATTGVIPVLVGAWGAFVVTAIFGVFLFRKAKT